MKDPEPPADFGADPINELLVKRICTQRQLLGVEDTVRDVQAALRSHARIYRQMAQAAESSWLKAVFQDIARSQIKLAKRLNKARLHTDKAHSVLRQIAP